uniref:succinate dehydrogenase assembly factor 3, mitochondrial isoform X2 n=1 Tax=Myxine glutinosa TaxID=7769 RepID=UPI00358E0668
MASVPHAVRVRSLYRRLLHLHRTLPSDLRVLGDRYVGEEFRRHKSASGAQSEQFLLEWQAYADQLQQQVHTSPQESRRKRALGQHLDTEMLKSLSVKQVEQLHRLMQETFKANQTDHGAVKAAGMEPVKPRKPRT